MILLLRLLLEFFFDYEDTLYIKHSRQCFIGYLNTSNFVKNTLLRVAFSTLFSMFGYPDETQSLMFDILHQGPKRMFDHISKHLEVLQKYSAARRIFNSLRGVWKCGQTRYSPWNTRINCQGSLTVWTTQNVRGIFCKSQMEVRPTFF